MNPHRFESDIYYNRSRTKETPAPKKTLINDRIVKTPRKRKDKRKK